MITPTPPRRRFPAICFIILSITMFLGGTATLGAFVLLVAYYPMSSTIHTAFVLALNGLLCWILSLLCIISGWKLFKHKANGKRFSKVAWVLVAGFTMWTFLFDGFSGWSTGGIAEVIIWGILEALIASRLMAAWRANAD